MANTPCTWRVVEDGVKLFNTSSGELIDHFLTFVVPAGDTELGWEEYAEWNNANIVYRWQDGVKYKTSRTQ